MVVGSRLSSNDSIFYVCTFFQGKTGVRDLKSDTSAYLLERVFFFPPLSEGIKSTMFFSFF